MKKTLLLLSLLLITAPFVRSQDDYIQDISESIRSDAVNGSPQDTTYWSHKGVAGVNMSQASYSNWATGGDPSIAFDALLNFDLEYRNSVHLWTTRLELAYGLNSSQSTGTRKTNDRIFLSSNYGYGIAKSLYLGGMFTFNTQFDKGFDFTATPNPTAQEYISKFMAPGYITLGAGIIWTPKTWLSITYSPTSWRGTAVFDERLSDEGAFGVTPGKRFLNQFGSNLIVEVKANLLENVYLYSRLDLYSNYLNNPQNVIVNWNNQITMKVSRWISASLNFSMIYDDNIRFRDESGNMVPKLQVKEVLGIGLQVTF